MTLREKLQQLQNELEVLKQENDQLKQRPSIDQEEFEALKKELEESKEKSSFYKSRLEETIKRKSIIENKYKKLRKAKTRFIYINPEGNIVADYKDALDELERLRFEVTTLYESNDKFEAENRLLRKEAEENEQIVALYSSDNSQLKEEIQQLKVANQQLRAKTISQDITLNSYKDKTINKTPILVQGSEHDFYPGEQKDILLEYLHEKIKNLDPYTRQYAVVKSILEANPEDGTRASIRQKLKEIFKDFKGFKLLTNAQNAELRELGFTYVPCGSGHSKIYMNGDERFMVTMAGTPSDTTRCLNQVSDIAKVLL